MNFMSGPHTLYYGETTPCCHTGGPRCCDTGQPAYRGIKLRCAGVSERIRVLDAEDVNMLFTESTANNALQTRRRTDAFAA